jgi:exonuclease III
MLIVGDINNPLSPMARSFRQIQNIEIIKPIDILNQLYLTDIYRTFHSNTKEYTFFSTSHGYFSKIEYIVTDKASFNRYMNIEVTPCTLSYHHGLKLDLNNTETIKSLQTYQY